MSSLRETSTLSDGTRYTEDDQYVKSAYPWHTPRTPAPAVTTAEYSTAPTYQYNVPPAQSATFADGSSHADDIKLSMRDEYGDITGLNARLGKNVPKIEALHQQNAQMKGQIMTLERQIAELREALANSVPREQYLRAQEELNALRMRIGQLEAELSQLRAEKAALEPQLLKGASLRVMVDGLLLQGANCLPPQGLDPVTMLVVPSWIEIQHTASQPESAFLRALEQGKLLGARTGADGKVYFPPKEANPATGQPLDQYIELADTGTVTTFAIINIPFAGQRIKPPYVAAYVLLDGADIPVLHLVADIEADQVRMGMRVQAVWKPREEWGLGIDNIEYFRPTGEPDADYDTYKHHL